MPKYAKYMLKNSKLIKNMFININKIVMANTNFIKLFVSFNKILREKMLWILIWEYLFQLLRRVLWIEKVNFYTYNKISVKK